MKTAPIDPSPFVLMVTEPLFDLGAKPGDCICVEPGAERPVIVLRFHGAAYGKLAAALAAGRLEPTILPSSEALCRLIALASETTRKEVAHAAS